MASERRLIDSARALKASEMDACRKRKGAARSESDQLDAYKESNSHQLMWADFGLARIVS